MRSYTRFSVYGSALLQGFSTTKTLCPIDLAAHDHETRLMPRYSVALNDQ
ncbi:MAG: hypothetical protein ACTXOO_04525 [Sodalis sp. (in: enterobacteria)]